MQKLDLKVARKALFSAPRDRFVLIEVPPVTYLMADGNGDPNHSDAYRAAVEGLYATAYTLKFICKAQDRDFVVPPLEGLWSAADPESFTARKKADWDWTMMIMVPDYVDQEMVMEATGRRESRGAIAVVPRLEVLSEGTCLQALHVGSYDDEGPLLARLHGEIMPQGGYGFGGRHHEIYLSDPRRTPAEKLKTLLRQPVRKA